MLYDNLRAGWVNVLPQYYPALAKYFVKFIQGYAARACRSMRSRP